MLNKDKKKNTMVNGVNKNKSQIIKTFTHTQCRCVFSSQKDWGFRMKDDKLSIALNELKSL